MSSFRFFPKSPDVLPKQLKIEAESGVRLAALAGHSTRERPAFASTPNFGAQVFWLSPRRARRQPEGHHAA